MKIFLKAFISILIVIIISLLIIVFYSNEKLPEGKKGENANILAKKMLKSLNYEAYKNVHLIEWSFKNVHHYKWYKQDNKVEVEWSDYKVILFTKKPSKSIVYKNGKQVQRPDFIEKSIQYFNNDSFWLIAPFKIFDSGTERRIVKHNGKDALLISYNSGGSTPGDSYLWILNDDYVPVSYKMWVKIIPIGGLEATWDNWITTDSGLKLPTNHVLELINLNISMENVTAK